MMTSRALTRSVNSRLGSLALIACLGGLSAGTSAQSQNQNTPAPSPQAQPQQPTNPAAASSPHQRDVTNQSAPEAAPTQGANQGGNPSAASSPHQRQVTGTGTLQEGMQVQDRSSHQPIGSVSQVIKKGTGDSHGYTVITTPDGMAVPVPSRVARSMAVDGKLLVDRSALSGAPKVPQSQFKETDSHLKQKSDRYWAAHAS